MMDVPDYARGIRHKREAYRANGIPALFLYPADLARRNWEEQIYKRIMSGEARQARIASKSTVPYGKRYYP